MALRLSEKALQRLLAGKTTAGNKFGAERVEYAGRLFDSKLEAGYYYELAIRESAGEVRGVRCQHEFALVVNGHLISKYRADFVFEERDETGQWTPVVADTKSEITRRKSDYRMKFKLMQALHGITIREVLALARRKSPRRKATKKS